MALTLHLAVAPPRNEKGGGPTPERLGSVLSPGTLFAFSILDQQSTEGVITHHSRFYFIYLKILLLLLWVWCVPYDSKSVSEFLPCQLDQEAEHLDQTQKWLSPTISRQDTPKSLTTLSNSITIFGFYYSFFGRAHHPAPR